MLWICPTNKTHSFFAGVVIDMDYLTKFKAAGGANNDWLCTHQILAKHNVTNVSLEEVTAKFEYFYQGDAERPGLWTKETLIPRLSLIKFLASVVPLAIVTGRPRADAERFDFPSTLVFTFLTLTH